MKIKIEIDCTPEEARKTMGLPDLAPMQARLLEENEARLRELLKDMDPKKLAEMWLPAASQGFDQLFQMWSKYGTNIDPGKRSP